jgi:hypothetical protein
MSRYVVYPSFVLQSLCSNGTIYVIARHEARFPPTAQIQRSKQKKLQPRKCKITAQHNVRLIFYRIKDTKSQLCQNYATDCDLPKTDYIQMH